MVNAIAKELVLRKDEFTNQVVETIYFGGGTPSVLSVAEIRFLLTTVYQNYTVIEVPEITLEANPDDLDDKKIDELAASPVNRLSIGIQSFFDDDLKLMNRAHSASEAKKSLQYAARYFDNISIDLIYGIPGMSNTKWLEIIKMALSFGVPHISSYALTVEPKTALKKLIATGKIAEPTDDAASEHFEILVETLTNEGFIHYELSNFGKENYFSKNNSSYWLGKKYLGVGPSAHSFNGTSRSWNVSNNALYIKSIQGDVLPNEIEILTITDQYNEYVMTGLRTIWGIAIDKVTHEYGLQYKEYLLKRAKKFIDDGLLLNDKNVIKTSKKGKFLSDGIASDLFMLNLDV